MPCHICQHKQVRVTLKSGFVVGSGQHVGVVQAGCAASCQLRAAAAVRFLRYLACSSSNLTADYTPAWTEQISRSQDAAGLFQATMSDQHTHTRLLGSVGLY